MSAIDYKNIKKYINKYVHVLSRSYQSNKKYKNKINTLYTNHLYISKSTSLMLYIHSAFFFATKTNDHPFKALVLAASLRIFATRALLASACAREEPQKPFCFFLKEKWSLPERPWFFLGFGLLFFFSGFGNDPVSKRREVQLLVLELQNDPPLLAIS